MYSPTCNVVSVTASWMLWTRIWSRASSCGQGFYSTLSGRQLPLLQSDEQQVGRKFRRHGIIPARHLMSPSQARRRQRDLSLDTIVSVLEVSATRRDAKGYLQTYIPKNPKSLAEAPEFSHDEDKRKTTTKYDDYSHVAIVKLRGPQYLDHDTLFGVAKTLSQLRVLGLISIVVLDCGIDEPRRIFEDQAVEMCEAVDSFAGPGGKLLEHVATCSNRETPIAPSFLSRDLRIEDQGRLKKALQYGFIPIIPALAPPDDVSSPRPVDANQLVLALTKFVSGMQFEMPGPVDLEEEHKSPRKIATVERVIVLDPLGGTPVPGRPGETHRFVNLAQEYDMQFRHLMGPDGSNGPPVASCDYLKASSTIHASNLNLAREALALLPSSSSALIMTPFAAANTGTGTKEVANLTKSLLENNVDIEFNGMVKTRRKLNPLLHNLLTDKPIYSSSLPSQRVPSGGNGDTQLGASTTATIIKRGMPLTIYPDPCVNRWSPLKPDGPRLRLTDNCIDLPRLVHLIEDSFGRKLDVQDYLKRVNENIAGIIIVGEYEGGAILTWERPPHLMEEEAYSQGRLVPYLDKFAVLRSRQGSGGVADIVFNAMVGDCFPEGVCWRSRKDNPVNKWYFERSSGTRKLPGCNWTMFWTTMGLDGTSTTMADYESVCRSVEPSWADNRHILD